MSARRPDSTPLVGDADAVIGCFENLSVVAGAFEGPDHIVVAVNSAAREVLGHREVLGKPAAEGIPELVSQEYLELLDRTLETGESFVATGWRNQLYAQAGAETEMYMDMELTPWLWPDGSVRGVVTQVTDVTQKVVQHQAQQARADEFEERYLTARDIVSTLQASLLPTHLPVLPQARTAARYLVAAEEQDAGGDWFDTQALDDGRVALTVGDVVGHESTHRR